MIDELKLLSGNDIPFPEGKITIHQPTLKELGLIDEKIFWMACEILKFNKEKVIKKDNFDLLNKTNFYIIMTMIRGKDKESIQAFLSIQLLLTLLFPGKKIQFDYRNTKIIIKNIQTEEIGEINELNFMKFQEVLIQMFCLNNNSNKQYNPEGPLARKIANKFKEDNQKRAQLAPQLEKIAIFSKYTSILAVGLKIDINILMNYTVYQLLDIFNRFTLYTNYKDWVKYKIAGATNLDKQPPDWLKDIHT